MTKKAKLELTWIGKENRSRLEPRILLEDPEKSYHAPHRVREAEYETAENAKSAENPDSLSSLQCNVSKLFIIEKIPNVHS